MPPTKTTSDRANARITPYLTSKPDNTAVSAATNDKENEAPEKTVSKKTSGAATKKKSTDKNGKKIPTKASDDLPDSYLDVVLEEKKGEVPCYENASAIRRKLNNLIEKKALIPGSTKTFNRTTMSNELRQIVQRHHRIEGSTAFDEGGPSVRSLTTFLKKSGNMGGGNSQCYYFGNMLLEKMRIWTGEKKTAAREKAEAEFPYGRVRLDPDTASFFCTADNIPSRHQVENYKR